MYEVMAGRYLAGLSRGVNVLQADWAVLPGDALDADVFAPHVDGQAHVALVAVEIVGGLPHSANAAAVAVKLVPAMQKRANLNFPASYGFCLLLYVEGKRFSS